MSKLYVVIFIFLFSFNAVYSLVDDCVPEDTCTWDTAVDTLDLSGYTYFEMKSIVYYRIQKCNGLIRFIIDSSTAVDNAEFLDTLKVEEMEFSALNNLIEMNLMLKSTLNNNSSIPDCNNDSIINVHFYTTACGVWVKCSYKVDPTLVQCDIGFSPPQPHYYLNGEYWIDAWRWHSCGTACCEKQYKLCIEYIENFNYSKQLTVTQISKKKIGQCTLQQHFKNWRNPEQIVPCKDDC